MSTDTTVRKSANAIPDNTEDRSKPGWPGLHDRPFVEPSYYEQFPAPLRPRFDMGGATTLALSLDDGERLKRMWTEKFPLVTVINTTDTEWATSIVGPTPGSVVGVIVPPFGVLRGMLGDDLKTKMHGSRFVLRRVIAPAGNCDHDPEDRRTTKIERTDGKPPEIIGGCHRFGCTLPGHWRPELVHTVWQAQMFVASLGEALASPDDPTHKASYIPILNEPKRGPQARIWAFKNVDTRADVLVFLGHRLDYLHTREATLKARADKGISTAGR